MRSRALPAVACLVFLSGCAVTPVTDPHPAATPPADVTASAPVTEPTVYVEVVASGLNDPVDVAPLPDGRILIAERGAQLLVASGDVDAAATPLHADFVDVDAAGGGALLGLAIPPDFATSRIFVTCQTHAEAGQLADVRLVRWQLSSDGTRADRVQDLVTGLPTDAVAPDAACRPTVAPDGTLFVGWGDTVYRLNPLPGAPAPDKPDDADANLERLRYTSGHGTIRAVAVRPGTGEVYAADTVPDLEDEVFALKAGNDYAADAAAPAWRSGTPPVGPAGMTFLSGSEWGTLDGGLAVAMGTGQQVSVLLLRDGEPAHEVVPEPLRKAYGALGAARSGADGALFVATATGTDDRVLRVAPAAG